MPALKNLTSRLKFFHLSTKGMNDSNILLFFQDNGFSSAMSGVHLQLPPQLSLQNSDVKPEVRKNHAFFLSPQIELQFANILMNI